MQTERKGSSLDSDSGAACDRGRGAGKCEMRDSGSDG